MTMSKIAAVGLAGLLSASILPITAANAFSPVNDLSGVVTAVDKAQRTITVGGDVIHYVSRDAIRDLDYADPGAINFGDIQRMLHVGDSVSLGYFLLDGKWVMTRINLE